MRKKGVFPQLFLIFLYFLLFFSIFRKSILQVPDTGTWVLDNTRPFLCSSIVSFWITLACSKEHKDHIFRQYWYTKNVPVLTNTGTFQYLGPEVYFFPIFHHLCSSILSSSWTAYPPGKALATPQSYCTTYYSLKSMKRFSCVVWLLKMTCF